MNAPIWQTQSQFLELRSPWMTVIGEHLQDDQGQPLDYWRIEKADSVVILPILQQQLILPPPSYRPGLGSATWDFPGGRLPEGLSPLEAAPKILRRELGVEAGAIAHLSALNSEGWAINSSFSNQRLHGLVAILSPTAQIPPDRVGATYDNTAAGISALLEVLTCLQCRLVLLQWQWSER